MSIKKDRQELIEDFEPKSISNKRDYILRGIPNCCIKLCCRPNRLDRSFKKARSILE